MRAYRKTKNDLGKPWGNQETEKPVKPRKLRNQGTDKILNKGIILFYHIENKI